MSRSNKEAVSPHGAVSRKPVIAITMGDPRGIGPEVIRKSLSKILHFSKYDFIVIGDRRILGRLPPGVRIEDVAYRTAGEGALKFLDRAISLIRDGTACALVTAPLSKEAVSRYHKNFVGHTEYLAEAFGVRNFDMMFIAPDVRLTILTRHVPIRDVPKLITRAAVFKAIDLMAKTLQSRFGIRDPEIALLGLNPHAGEGGLLGSEDIKSIVPAIARARAGGTKASGPFPADTFFAFHKSFDGIIAMYHDQGLAPLKGMYMKELVNFTAGLPFVRTSPAHGTAFDIAGKNKADPASMFSAIKLACQLA
jgi:4-hydroxythreonine-4-phosphate dehydrogenase